MVYFIINFSQLFIFSELSEWLKVIIPIVFGIWGVLYIRKPKFYYLERSNIKLYQDIVKSIEGISITYKGQAIQENLRFVSGTIILKSHTDIRKDEIDEEITIICPDTKALWRHFEIVKASNGFRPKYEVTGNTVLIHRSLLKRDDYVTFSGLLDSKISNILIGHRIYNIIPGSINLKEENLSLYRSYLILFPFLIVMFLLFNFSNNLSASARNESNTVNGITREDSIEREMMRYDPTFTCNSSPINIDSLEDIETEYQTLRLKDSVNNKLAATDSLIMIYDNSRSDQDKIKVLLSHIDYLEIDKNPWANHYLRLKMSGRDTLRSLLDQGALDTSKYYRLNDSIAVKYSPNILASISGGDQNSVFSSYNINLVLSFLMYLLFLFAFYLFISNMYKFFLLRRLIRLYKNRVDVSSDQFR